MYSGRKESVGRHIKNPNIHMGKGTVIPFSDSLIVRQAGVFVSNPRATGMYNKRRDSFVPKTSEAFAMFEKAYWEKMADNVVNFAFASRNQPTYYNYNIPHVNYYNYSLKNTQDVYAIEMQVCPDCLMIEPVKILYTKDENSGGIRSHICSSPPGYVLESQRHQYQPVIAEDDLRQLLKKWLDCIMPSPKDRRIVAIPVPQFSPSNSLGGVRLSVNESGSEPFKKKYLSISCPKEKCSELSLSKGTERGHWRTRVLENGNTTIANDDELMDYLSCTKNSTYAFLRINSENPFNHSMRIPSGSIYLIMLLFGNNGIPEVDNVFDTV